MDRFQMSCAAPEEYPLNLIRPTAALYDLHNGRDMLRNIAPRTFAPADKAALEFWEGRDNGFLHTLVNSRESLRLHLNTTNQGPQCAPLYRFMFIRANTSRAKLLITEAMLKDLLTYFQVMVYVVSMLASFGLDAGKDFQHCQFEADARLSPKDVGLAVPELKRSGRIIEMAYVFRTVEPSGSIPGMKWQIKQTCAHHNFDLETGLNTWILIKGSDLVKRRVMEGLQLPSTTAQTADASLTESFLFSLNVHVMLADLSVENWREYINSLEREVQKVTKATTFKPVQAPKTTISPTTDSSNDPIKSFGFGGRSRSRIYTQLSRSSTFKSWITPKDGPIPKPGAASTILPTTQPPANQHTLSQFENVQEEQDEEEAYFGCLQVMKVLEEQALESLLVLKSSVRIWKQLQRTYDEYVSDDHFPPKLYKDSQRGLKRFHSRLDSTQDSLENQVLRVEALLALLSGRKTLVTWTYLVVPSYADECLATKHPGMA